MVWSPEAENIGPRARPTKTLVKHRSRSVSREPTRSQEEAKTAQEEAKTKPKEAQEEPGGAQENPKRAQEDAKRSPEADKTSPRARPTKTLVKHEPQSVPGSLRTGSGGGEGVFPGPRKHYNVLMKMRPLETRYKIQDLRDFETSRLRKYKD